MFPFNRNFNDSFHPFIKSPRRKDRAPHCHQMSSSSHHPSLSLPLCSTYYKCSPTLSLFLFLSPSLLPPLFRPFSFYSPLLQQQNQGHYEEMCVWFSTAFPSSPLFPLLSLPSMHSFVSPTLSVTSSNESRITTIQSFAGGRCARIGDYKTARE